MRTKVLMMNRKRKRYAEGMASRLWFCFPRLKSDIPTFLFSSDERSNLVQTTMSRERIQKKSPRQEKTKRKKVALTTMTVTEMTLKRSRA